MPGSKKNSVLPSTDDLLVRLLALPPAEQNTVMRQVATAVHAAERRSLRAEHAAYDAAHPIGTPGHVRPARRPSLTL